MNIEKRLFLLLFLPFFLITPAYASPKTIVIKGPTIIAFFDYTKEKIPEVAFEQNEALSDFQFYLNRLIRRLDKSTVAIHEYYGKSFYTKKGTTVTLFSPKEGVGYYFITPRKKPFVSYGVLDDGTLIKQIDEYFGIKVSDH